MLLTEDGRLAFLDFGLMGTVEPRIMDAGTRRKVTSCYVRSLQTIGVSFLFLSPSTSILFSLLSEEGFAAGIQHLLAERWLPLAKVMQGTTSSSLLSFEALWLFRGTAACRRGLHGRGRGRRFQEGRGSHRPGQLSKQEVSRTLARSAPVRSSSTRVAPTRSSRRH